MEQNSARGRALTKRRVDAARYEGAGRAHCVVWDDELRGFGLRVQPTGRKSFVVFYRTASGTKRLHTLGRYPALTVDQARRAAKRTLAEVAGGADPAAERRRGREAATFAALAESFLEQHARVHKKSVRDDERYVGKTLVPAFGARKAEDVLRVDVAALHRRVGGKAPYAANRALATLSSMYSWGERAGFLPEGHPNPARGIAKFREVRRDRWVTPEEMPRLAAAIRAEPNRYARAAIWLYLLLGARKTELLRAKWSDIDLERAAWRLPETKAGRPHYLPLSPPALAVLLELPREQSNPHVFPGTRTREHLVNIDKAWRRIRKAAAIEDVRLHDLRRTVGSWLAQAGASLPLIGRVLNHTTPGTTAIYARLADETSRVALDAHAVAVLAAAREPMSILEGAQE